MSPAANYSLLIFYKLKIKLYTPTYLMSLDTMLIIDIFVLYPNIICESENCNKLYISSPVS